jgi:hypothetical protein
MSYAGPLDAVPLGVLFAATLVGVGLAVEGGFRLGTYRRSHAPEKETPVGVMVGAMLGLLAFMLAFTFGFAASRFDERRHTILDEANAIGTTYLRAGLRSEPWRAEVRQLLREYVSVRLEAVQPGRLEQALTKSTELHQQLWQQAAAAASQDPHSIVIGLFIQSLNETIDMHSTRVVVGIRSRLPATIWGALFLVALLAMTSLGYHEGLAGTRRSLASLALVVAFAVVLFLIVDLDRPLEGMLQTSQQTMLDLQKSLSAPD